VEEFEFCEPFRQAGKFNDILLQTVCHGREFVCESILQIGQ